MVHRLLIFIFLLTISTILHAQRKWERSLQPIDVAALPSAQIQSGQESLKKEMIMAGRMNVAAGGPFIACSIGWDEDGVAATNSQLRISTSRDSSEWSAWIDLTTDGHAVEAKWQACTQLVYLPAGSRYWKIEVTSILVG